ncbi:Phytosulfokine protein [Dioscorea alata]|uniref:Phytosulfokine protein n=1 Tax=Dioscorea alata TaxID=55571 RepID=A0ACB7VZJ2_DIOAL|nr:Phytosulfokine protein [Dioscorea alata]
MKKQPVVRLLVLLIFLLVLAIFLTNHNAEASRTPKGPVKDEVKIDDKFLASVLDHYLEITSGDVSDTMGTPDRCDDGDRDCMKRRMMSEAHLDYIYTQHQEP